jgi:hypothetical protein
MNTFLFYHRQWRRRRALLKHHIIGKRENAKGKKVVKGGVYGVTGAPAAALHHNKYTAHIRTMHSDGPLRLTELNVVGAEAAYGCNVCVRPPRARSNCGHTRSLHDKFYTAAFEFSSLGCPLLAAVLVNERVN